VSVLSGNITTDTFSAQLSISNATSWMQGGELNINSASAGVIWALGTIPVSDPGDPDTSFQQHKVMGTFSIDMKAAQVAESDSGSGSTGSATSGAPSPTGSSPTQTSDTSNPILPTITGGVAPVLDIGLTQRDKVLFP
jgi:Cytochrome domain of cellobiose dehydrogenase